MFTWGQNQYGQLGLGIEDSFQALPTEVIHLRNLGIVEVVSGAYHIYARTCRFIEVIV